MDLKIILLIFVMGIVVLAGALIVNILANLLNLNSWYDFTKSISEKGFLEAFKAERFNLLWLFIVYPFLLGLISYFSYKFIIKF